MSTFDRSLRLFNLLSASPQLSINVLLKIKTKMLNKYFIFFIQLSIVEFILLINVQIPTIVGILTFMSTINVLLIFYLNVYIVVL